MSICSVPNCPRGGQLRRGKCHACYEKWRIRQHAYGRFDPEFIDATETLEHIQKLRAAGTSWRRIAELAGIYRTQLMRLRTATKIGRGTAERILAIPVPAAKHLVAADHDCVPAIGAARRIRALTALGWTQSYLANRLGMSVGNLYATTHLTRDFLTVRRDRDIRVLFEELQMQRGPSVRARNLAVKYGWALPLEWDEESIDDPAAQPHRVRRTKRDDFVGRAVERREAVRDLTDRGLSAEDIAIRLRTSARQVQRDRSAA
ncbi:DNA-binding protein [Rhodococcus artemisiae]|uniref:DNA-binding protein n=1 Tax=Rhodococcus artemisiae TaxID=714159 RepID=A0ABU7LBM3_9NOCA|nr:DNA-binding protein [Rhodococcus artemisiae]MEE2058943.1 DNA-binding protein [Rhodococcus artemisiae]